MSAAGRRASAPRSAARQQDAAADVVLINDESVRALREAAAVEGRAHRQGDAAGRADRRAEGRRRRERHAQIRARDGDRPRRPRGGHGQPASASPTTRWCSRPARATASCRCFPEGQPGIYYLRTADEALALKAHLGLAKSLHPDRRRRGRAGDRGVGGRARHQGHRDRDRAAHPGARLRRGNLRDHPPAPPRPRRRHPHRHGLRRLAGACRTASSRS